MAACAATPQPIHRYRPYWAKRFGVAPFLPMSRQEMTALGWDSCDIIIVTGDAYVDHPSFGMALIGRLLEAQGFRVGIISQPQWHSTAAFQALGRPNLYFGITSGNMDSMVNHYTAERRIRSDDAYSPNGVAGLRPDRAVLVYAQRCREAYPDATIVLGGIEASLRRLAHYDYWSDKVRRSVLVDSKADILLYGNAERAVVELSHRLAAGVAIGDIGGCGGAPHIFIGGLRGSALLRSSSWQPHERVVGGCPPHLRGGAWGCPPHLQDGWLEWDCRTPDKSVTPPGSNRNQVVIRLPSYEQVRTLPLLYAHATRILHLESNPGNARVLVQGHGNRDLWVNRPPWPLTTPELDYVYDLPYARRPHPAYGNAKIPAWEMIHNSITIMRGCFGGCTFCSITTHEGRVVQNRSQASILREIQELRQRGVGFTGVVSDLGGPTANMYRMACSDPNIAKACRRFSCVYPSICTRLHTSHDPLVALYRAARSLPGIKRVLIGSGIRYDLASTAPTYVQELVTHHVGGYLKIAPEHTEANPLRHMLKPGIDSYERFQELFVRYSRAAGKEQYLIPYFIAAHPGTSDDDMLQLALWLKNQGLRLEQVQTFLPTPLCLATAMYHSGFNPLYPLAMQHAPTVTVARGGRQRRLHKALLRYHVPENWPLLREALRAMQRADLIGHGKRHLVPR